MSQLIQVLDSLNKIMSKESQSFAQPHHPSRINFPLHHTWPTITIKHHPLGIKIQWPLCSMRMRPQLVLPRLSPANPGVHPRRFAHMAHSTAHRIVFRYSSHRSVISCFATGSLSPKPVRSSELLRRGGAFNHDLKSKIWKGRHKVRLSKLEPKRGYEDCSGYYRFTHNDLTHSDLRCEPSAGKKSIRSWNYVLHPPSPL